MRNLKILVVDDDKDNADSLGELLELEGHQTRVVYSGQQAIFAYLESDFDMAFMDVMMPGMNGVESFMEIRKLKPKANVFMMSGYSVQELLNQAMAEGALGMLTKPLEPGMLLSAVRDVGNNGVLVAHGQGPQFLEDLQRQANDHNTRCHIVSSAAAIERASAGADLLVLNTNMPLIDTIGLYAALRKAHDFPPTAILGPNLPQTSGEDSFRNMLVTGILNKPFDPDRVLLHVQTVAA